jgi:hypothetical protein
MNKDLVFYALFIILGASISVSFYNLAVLQQKQEQIQALLDFKDKGARYTWRNGQEDKAIRDQQDAFLQSQIDELANRCQ